MHEGEAKKKEMRKQNVMGHVCMHGTVVHVHVHVHVYVNVAHGIVREQMKSQRQMKGK